MSKVYIPVKLQNLVRERFKNCCAYCHTAESLTIAIFEFEHVIPLANNGETTYENLCLACPTCNRYKAHRQTATDPQSKQIVPLFHPLKQQWLEHFQWSEDATQIIGLTPTGRATIITLKMNRPQLIRVRKMWVKMGEHPPQFD